MAWGAKVILEDWCPTKMETLTNSLSCLIKVADRSADAIGFRSPALAAFTVVFAVGQMAGPYLAGLLADSYGAGATLVWTAALCAAGSVASLTVRSAGKP